QLRHGRQLAGSGWDAAHQLRWRHMDGARYVCLGVHAVVAQVDDKQVGITQQRLKLGRLQQINNGGGHGNVLLKSWVSVIWRKLAILSGLMIPDSAASLMAHSGSSR